MSPEQHLDIKIAELGDWRGERLAWYRNLVKAQFPELTEELKWGVGVFTYKGKPVLASSAFKGHVKFNFFHGVELTDTHGILNSGLDSKEHRSVNLAESDTVNEKALTDLITQALRNVKNK